MCNGAAKQVSAGIAPCNIKCRSLFGNVETGLKMLLPDSRKIIRYQFHALGRERAKVQNVNMAASRDKKRRALAVLILVDMFEGLEEEGKKRMLGKETE